MFEIVALGYSDKIYLPFSVCGFIYNSGTKVLEVLCGQESFSVDKVTGADLKKLLEDVTNYTPPGAIPKLAQSG